MCVFAGCWGRSRLPPERRYTDDGHQGGVERGYDVGAGGRKVVPRWGRRVAPHSQQSRGAARLGGHVGSPACWQETWCTSMVAAWVRMWRADRNHKGSPVWSSVLRAARLLTASWRWLDLRLWGHPVLLGHWPSSSAQHCNCSTSVHSFSIWRSICLRWTWKKKCFKIFISIQQTGTDTCQN